MSERKTYLGDAVYADFDSFGALVLTTEDGYRATNTIVLDVDVWEAVKEYVARAKLARGAAEAEPSAPDPAASSCAHQDPEPPASSSPTSGKRAPENRRSTPSGRGNQPGS